MEIRPPISVIGDWAITSPRPLPGYGHAEDRRTALAAGFDAHLVKPVEPEVLQQVLAEQGAATQRDVNRGRSTANFSSGSRFGGGGFGGFRGGGRGGRR